MQTSSERAKMVTEVGHQLSIAVSEVKGEVFISFHFILDFKIILLIQVLYCKSLLFADKSSLGKRISLRELNREATY